MINFPIIIYNNDGTPNNDLVKANVTIKDSGNNELEYSEFIHTGDFGNYLITGCNFKYQPVNIFINNNLLPQFANIELGSVSQWANDLYLKLSGGQMSGTLDMHQNKIFDLKDPVQDNDAATKIYADTKLAKSGGKMTGAIDLDGQKILNAPVPVNPGDVANKAYVDITNIVNDNIIIVDATITTNVAGKRYKTIQEAINYAHDQTPSATKQFTILILPHSSADGYIENITLQAFVNLTGIGKPLISGSLTGGNANTRIRNVNITYHGNLSLTNVKAEQCNIRVTNDDTGNILTVTGCVLNNCGLINVGQQEFNPAIVSGGNNIFINCGSNIACTLISGDKGFINSLESVTTDFS